MRELKFLENEDEVSQDTFDLLLRGPHSQPLCPRLLKLSWFADPVFGGDFTSFLSPQLRDIHLTSRPGTQFPFAHAISILPISTLESLRLSITGDEPVNEAIAFMFRTITRSLRTLEISGMDQLQDDTWRSIMFYPRLRSLETDQRPPTFFLPGIPVCFPSLQKITLRGPAASGWIWFLTQTSSNAGPQPRRVAPHLVQLYCEYRAELGATLIPHLCVFRNLSRLILRTGCSPAMCTFLLADEDISRLAIEFPGLREFSIGPPCANNSCRTTTNSLLVLSTRCKGLQWLSIHFNTRNFARDMENSLYDPLRRNSHPPQRCPLTVLNVGITPLTMEALGEDVYPTLAGLVDIFPRLQRIRFHALSSQTSRGWQQLSTRIPGFQEMRKSLPAVFTQ